jgi:hypothetical protein
MRICYLAILIEKETYEKSIASFSASFILGFRWQGSNSDDKHNYRCSRKPWKYHRLSRARLSEYGLSSDVHESYKRIQQYMHGDSRHNFFHGDLQQYGADPFWNYSSVSPLWCCFFDSNNND